jgi:hypothetical protein
MIRLDRDAMVDLAQNGPSVCSDMRAFHRLRASRIRSSHRLHLRRYIVPITRSSLRATMAPVDQTGRAEVRRRLPGSRSSPAGNETDRSRTRHLGGESRERETAARLDMGWLGEFRVSGILLIDPQPGGGLRS